MEPHVFLQEHDTTGHWTLAFSQPYTGAQDLIVKHPRHYTLGIGAQSHATQLQAPHHAVLVHSYQPGPLQHHAQLELGLVL